MLPVTSWSNMANLCLYLGPSILDCMFSCTHIWHINKLLAVMHCVEVLERKEIYSTYIALGIQRAENTLHSITRAISTHTNSAKHTTRIHRRHHGYSSVQSVSLCIARLAFITETESELPLEHILGTNLLWSGTLGTEN